MPDAQGDQKEGSDPLELELHTTAHTATVGQVHQELQTEGCVALGPGFSVSQKATVRVQVTAGLTSDPITYSFYEPGHVTATVVATVSSYV